MWGIRQSHFKMAVPDQRDSLIIPGLTPSTLGEIYVYSPTLIEVRVAAGAFALGFLVFTALLRVAVAILLGQLRLEPASGLAQESWEIEPA